MKIPKFNIPGYELRIKLNSAEVFSPEKLSAFENTMNKLIGELVNEDFHLSTEIRNSNVFSINIRALPNQHVKAYKISLEVGIFKWIYDCLYIVLSNNNLFHGFGNSYSRFYIPTLNVPD